MGACRPHESPVPRNSIGRRRPTHASRTYPIDGLSAGAIAEVIRLEETRNYLSAGDVYLALRIWHRYVRSTARVLWADHERDGPSWDCCGDPFAARDMLDTVIAAMSTRHGRELRRLVEADDALGPSR